MLIYGYFGYMFFSVSCLQARESPPPPGKGFTLYVLPLILIVCFAQITQKRNFLDFCSFFEPQAHNYKGKEPIMTKKVFHFTWFFWDTEFPRKGFYGLLTFLLTLWSHWFTIYWWIISRLFKHFQVWVNLYSI